VAAVYLKKHGKSMKKHVGDDVSGDYKKTLLALIPDNVENI
jgi:hypothetical protein